MTSTANYGYGYEYEDYDDNAAARAAADTHGGRPNLKQILTTPRQVLVVQLLPLLFPQTGTPTTANMTIMTMT